MFIIFGALFVIVIDIVIDRVTDIVIAKAMLMLMVFGQGKKTKTVVSS